MKKQLLATLLLSLTCHLTQAESGADADSTQKMLELMQAPTQLEQSVLVMEERFVRSPLDSWRKVRNLTAEQEAQLNATEARLSELLRAHFSWERMQPKFVRFFSKELTSTEIDQAITFYSSEQNQDMPEKLYVVTIRSNGLILEEASRIQQLIQYEMRKDLEATGIVRPRAERHEP